MAIYLTRGWRNNNSPATRWALLFRSAIGESNCHENVTQIAEDGGKNAANDNK
jgi:hypothetical protein